MPLADGEFSAGFQIPRPLGVGGMSEVYLVAHPRLPRQDALVAVTPRDATSVTARIRYVLREGRTDTEDRWLSVVPTNGQLLIYDSERIGPA
jgi:hypothetical protein